MRGGLHKLNNQTYRITGVKFGNGDVLQSTIKLFYSMRTGSGSPLVSERCTQDGKEVLIAVELLKPNKSLKNISDIFLLRCEMGF